MKTEINDESSAYENLRKCANLCRICLTEESGMWLSVFETRESAPFSQKIMLCTKIQVSLGDGLPDIICDQCSKDLNVVDNFRIKCESSDSILRKFYKYEDNKDLSIPGNIENSSTLDIKVEPASVDFINDSDTDMKNDVILSEDSTEDIIPVDKNCKSKKRKRRSSNISIEQCESKGVKSEVEVGRLSDKVGKLKDDSDLINDADGVVPTKFNCQECGKPLTTEISLKKHMKKMHSVERNKNQVGRVSGYGATRRYHCDHCEYVTRFRTDLVSHVRRHTGERPYRCDECGRSFAQHATLSNHRKTHSDTMDYTCPHCGRQFKYKNRFERHRAAHGERQLYPCTICGKGLRSPKILEEHTNRHYNIKNFACETCGATFVTFSEMTVHARTHGGEKRFSCTLCAYRTQVKASLDKHVRRHTGERPYSCTSCSWACYTRGELSIHTRIHSKERNYPCPLCSTRFKSSSGVNKHMVRTHGVKFKWSDHKDRRVIK